MIGSESSVVLAVIGEGQLTSMITDLAGSESWFPNSLLVKLPSLSSHSDWMQLQKADAILWIQEETSSHVPNQDVESELKQRQSSPWLCASYTSTTGYVGPWVQPDSPGCSQCSASRRIIADMEEPPAIDLAKLLQPEHDRLDDSPLKASASSIGSAALAHMAHLLFSELRRFRQGLPINTTEAYYELDLNSMAAKLHRFIPDPACPVCGRLVLDSPETALPPLVPLPKRSPDTYRTRPLEDLLMFLKKDYVDSKSGLFTELKQELLTPFPVITAQLPQLTTKAEYTAGRTLSYSASEGTAILEGLERYCGIAPRGKLIHVYGSYEALKHHAVDPRRLGHYSEEQYNQPDFPYSPFDASAPTSWVWGFSLTENRPVLVPESIAYYSAGYADSFVEETSNGCSLGASLSEAVLHGMLEVIERDGFLMTWYHKLPLPPVEPASAASTELQWMNSRLMHIYGYEVHLFNMTMETGIPGIWAILRNRKEHGAKLINAASAHPDPEQAAINALHEAAALIPVLNAQFANRQEDSEQMVRDSSLVRQMNDHILLYAHPKAESRLDFLLKNSRKRQSFQEVADDAIRPGSYHWAKAAASAVPDGTHTSCSTSILSNSDLTADVQDLVARFRSLNLEVIVVNQTGSEIERNNLYCVKVLIPGMLPMSFGHHLKRLSGLSRLTTTPGLLGYRCNDAESKPTNPFPHPFP